MATFVFFATAFGFADQFSLAKPSEPHARVVTVYDRDATDTFIPVPSQVRLMVDRGIMKLTGEPTPKQAWLSLVSTQDVVGIKVYSRPGPNSGTRPEVAAAVARGLIAAGLPPRNVVIWDKSDVDLHEAGFFDIAKGLGVRVTGSVASGYDMTNYYDTPLLGNLVWGDVEFGKSGTGVGRKSFVSKLVSRELTKIINLPPLLNHNYAGVCGNLYGLAMASVDNTFRFENDQTRLAKAVPEIYAMAAVGDKVVLNITDALLCQYEGTQRSLLHYSAVLNQLRFSRDPVALDVLAIKELDRQRRNARAPYIRPNFELYANAAILDLGVNDISRIQVENAK